MFTKRQTSILEIIIKNASGVTGAKIAEKLTVSSRTIRSDIAQINSSLKDSEISVSSCRKNGYYIELRYIEKVQALLSKERELNSDYHIDDYRDLIILGKVLFEGKQNIYDLSEMLFVSTRTIYKVIKNLQESMKSRFSFDGIRFEKENVFVQASEEEIRRLLFKIVNISVFKKTISLKEVQIVLNDNFSLNNLEGICDRVKKCFIEKERFVDEEYIIILSWILYIAYIRNSNGYLIQQEEMLLCDNIALQTIEDLKQAGIEIDENDIGFIYKFLLTKKLTSDDKISDITNVIQKDFVNEIKERYDISLEGNDIFIDACMEYLEYMLRRIQSDYQFINPIKDDIKKRYPFAYEVSLLIVDIVYKHFEKYPTDDEVANIAICIEQFMSNFNYKIKLLMIGNPRIGIDSIIQRWINGNFYNKVELVDKISLNQLNTYAGIGDIDIIISPVNIATQASIPTYILESIPDNEDIQSLKELIHKVNLVNKFEQVIKKCFDKDLIEIYDEECSFKDIVTKQAEKLKASECIFEVKEFVDSIMAREESYPTIIGDSVMIPRPTSVFSDEIKVSIAVLKKPIYISGKNIRIIFLSTKLKNVDEDLSFLYELYKKVALNKYILRSLVDLEDKDEFLEKFIELSKNIK